MSLQLIFLGAPGSGKGTQAKMLVKEFSFHHISTGDLLRAEVKKGSSLGKRLNDVMSRGDLVEDSLVLELLKENCDLEKGAHIFDGFPRNLEQAKSLDEKVLKGANVRAIHFQIDLEALIKRTSNRRICSDCGSIYNLITFPPKKNGFCDQCGGKNLVHRKDDHEDVIRNRLVVFEENNGPVVNYYRSKGILITVDAGEDVDVLFKEIKSEIEEML